MMGHRLVKYTPKFALMGLRPPQNPTHSEQLLWSYIDSKPCVRAHCWRPPVHLDQHTSVHWYRQRTLQLRRATGVQIAYNEI